MEVMVNNSRQKQHFMTELTTEPGSYVATCERYLI